MNIQISEKPIGTIAVLLYLVGILLIASSSALLVGSILMASSLLALIIGVVTDPWWRNFSVGSVVFMQVAGFIYWYFFSNYLTTLFVLLSLAAIAYSSMYIFLIATDLMPLEPIVLYRGKLKVIAQERLQELPIGKLTDIVAQGSKKYSDETIGLAKQRIERIEKEEKQRIERIEEEEYRKIKRKKPKVIKIEVDPQHDQAFISQLIQGAFSMRGFAVMNTGLGSSLNLWVYYGKVGVPEYTGSRSMGEFVQAQGRGLFEVTKDNTPIVEIVQLVNFNGVDQLITELRKVLKAGYLMA